jgi:hypothetical protein
MANSAIIDPKTGKPFVKVDHARHNHEFDMSNLPKGVTASWKQHEQFMKRLENDTALREKLEKADRQLGTKSLCLMRFDNRYGHVIRVIENAAKRCENWMRQKKAQKLNKGEGYEAVEALQHAASKNVV